MCLHPVPKKSHNDLHDQWKGAFGFDFPFNDLVDMTADPVALKTDTCSIDINKIINDVKLEASHTAAAEIPKNKVKLKNLLLVLIHQSLCNNCKSHNNINDLNSACCRIQSARKKNEVLDVTVQLNIGSLHLDLCNFDFHCFSNHAHNKAFPATPAVAANQATAVTGDTIFSCPSWRVAGEYT